VSGPRPALWEPTRPVPGRTATLRRRPTALYILVRVHLSGGCDGGVPLTGWPAVAQVSVLLCKARRCACTTNSSERPDLSIMAALSARLTTSRMYSARTERFWTVSPCSRSFRTPCWSSDVCDEDLLHYRIDIGPDDVAPQSSTMPGRATKAALHPARSAPETSVRPRAR
jgi:hypothetical protein